MHPNILYFLFLLIIPIIIHLFNFRRYKKLYFSSLQFIQQVEKKTSSTKSLRKLLILITRLIAFACLIIAFAQPYFPVLNQSDAYKTSIPIYLDNSFSMSAKGTNGDLLNQAKETVRKIVSSYPKNQQFILLTNALNGGEFLTISASEVENKLQYIQLSPLSRTLSNPLESLQHYLRENGDHSTHHYYIISDFQQKNLSNDKIKLDTSGYYSLFQITPQLHNNVYIDSVWFNEPNHRINTNNELSIRIQNTGKEKLFNVEVNLKIDGKNRQTLADLNANNSTVVTMNYSDQKAGIKSGEVTVQDKNLFFDNQFYFSYRVRKQTNVLLINGEKSVPLPKLVYATDDFYHLTEMDENQLNTSQLGTADLIVLNGLESIGSGLQTQLKQLEKEGMHILVIPAVNFDKNTYNSFLSWAHLPLLNTGVEQPIRVGKIADHQAFFSGMFNKKTENVRMPPLNSYLTSTASTNDNSTTLIRYENGMPLFACQAQTESIFMLYTPINPTFNTFGKSALFSSILLRLGEISGEKNPLYLTIGSTETFSVKTPSQQEVTLQLKKDAIAFIPELEQTQNRTQISVQKALKNQFIEDGIYVVLQGKKELDKIALNYNRKESDMRFANSNDLTKYMDAHHIRHYSTNTISNGKDIQTIPLKKPNELWRILLTLALIFFGIEMSLIIFWKVK